MLSIRAQQFADIPFALNAEVELAYLQIRGVARVGVRLSPCFRAGSLKDLGNVSSLNVNDEVPRG